MKDESQIYDPIPEEYDPNAPIPTKEEIAALAAKQKPVDFSTAAASGPYPAVNTQLTDGTGVFGYYDKSKRYGLLETVAAIREIANIWDKRYSGQRFGVGDISKRGGGDIDGHASHEKGVDVDVRPMRKEFVPGPVEYTDSFYDQYLTQELIDLFWTNSKLGIQFLWFNDPLCKGVTSYPNHDNHFHVRFYHPGVGVSPPILEQGNGFRAANNELQRCLNFWKPGPNPDGNFGSITLARVREFQDSEGLTVDGKVGPLTWAKLPRWPV